MKTDHRSERSRSLVLRPVAHRWAVVIRSRSLREISGWVQVMDGPSLLVRTERPVDHRRARQRLASTTFEE